MAPLKEPETTVASTSPSASPSSAAKSPTESTGRLQTVALEIPVTINGARTTAGSDKREPFSESTQTVLVFGHGAVVRVSTALAPGQLVFLTNEKTKKEVVCQVVKSKSSGAGSNYIELQFTEAAPAFWGLRIAGAPTAAIPAPIAPAPRSLPPVASPTVSLSKAIPAPAGIPKPESLVPKISAPAPEAIAPPVTMRVPSAAPSVPGKPAPLVSVPPPSPFTASPAAPAAKVPQETPAEQPVAAIPLPPVHDYAKEIESLFALPSSSSAPPAPVASGTSEALKLETSRLHAQLESLLFTQAPTLPKTAPPAPQHGETPAGEEAKKVRQVDYKKPQPASSSEGGLSILPSRKPSASGPSAEEQEVKIPAWLAPLSNDSESVSAEVVDAVAVDAEPKSQPVIGESSESHDTMFHRPETAVFGGQLLGESLPDNAAEGSTQSRKGVWIGMAAAVLALAAAGAWYLRPDLFTSAATDRTQRASGPTATAAVTSPARAVSENKVPSTGVASEQGTPEAAVPSVAATSQLMKKTATTAPTPVSSPVSVAPAHELKNFTTEARNPTPPPPAARAESEAEKKTGLGEVKLAKPVVNRGSAAPQDSEALPSLDTHTANASPDALSVLGTHANQPSAPLPVGGEVQAAQLIKSVPPIYPAMAKSQHISGSVQIDALIDASGNVAELKILSGPSLLHRAALDAVKQWKYKPAMLNGQTTSMHLTVTVQFRVQ